MIVLTALISLLINYVDFFLCLRCVRGLRDDAPGWNLQKRLRHISFLYGEGLGAGLGGRGLLQGLKGRLLHETRLGFQLQLRLLRDQDLVHVYHLGFNRF